MKIISEICQISTDEDVCQLTLVSFIFSFLVQTKTTKEYSLPLDRCAARCEEDRRFTARPMSNDRN